jgi:hypothetical protein
MSVHESMRKAYDAGQAACKTDRSITNPHPRGSAQFGAWNLGYLEAIADPVDVNYEPKAE